MALGVGTGLHAHMIPFGSVSLNETAVAEVESQRRTGLTGSPAGIPVPAARRQPGSRPDPSLFNPVFTGRSRTVYWLLSAVWIGLLAWFWAWWLQPSNIISLPRYIAVSLLFAWLTILPNTRLRMCRAPAGLSQPVRSGPLRCDSREVLA